MNRKYMNLSIFQWSVQWSVQWFVQWFVQWSVQWSVKRSVLLTILLLAVFSLSASTSMAGTDPALSELLKRRHMLRELEFERTGDIGKRVPARRILSQTLPVDTDDDGMPDPWETANSLNPGDPNDAWLDPDADGVINLFEYQFGSAPNSSATPAIVFVASSGADYSEIGTAIDSAAPGTVIRVAGGSYPVNYRTFDTKVVMIQGGWNQTFTQRDLKAFPTVFDGQLAEEILYFSFDSGEPVVILDGIKFVRANGFFGAVNLLAEDSAFLKTSIVSCTVSGSGKDCDSAVKMHNWDASGSDRTIVNTIIADNEIEGIEGQITVDGIARWRIINLTIFRNQGKGIDLQTTGSGSMAVRASNSIFWGNAESDIDIDTNITLVADHSDIGSMGSGGDYQPGAGIINSDPLFFDADHGDYRLTSASPCKDTGTSAGAPGADIDGDARPAGADFDMGAEEFVSGQNQAKIYGRVTTSITGQVAGIFGAKVTIVETGQSAFTDAGGDYVLADVPAGTYTLEIEKSNFSTTQLSSINVSDEQIVLLPPEVMVIAAGDECGLPGDVNGDDVIDLIEKIYSLQVVSGLRQ